MTAISRCAARVPQYPGTVPRYRSATPVPASATTISALGENLSANQPPKKYITIATMPKTDTMFP